MKNIEKKGKIGPWSLLTIALGGCLCILLGIWLISVAILHIEPFLSGTDKIWSFLYNGGLWGTMLVLFGTFWIIYVKYTVSKG
jgi:hypothetical protein